MTNCLTKYLTQVKASTEDQKRFSKYAKTNFVELVHVTFSDVDFSKWNKQVLFFTGNYPFEKLSNQPVR